MSSQACSHPEVERCVERVEAGIGPTQLVKYSEAQKQARISHREHIAHPVVLALV